MSNAFKGVIILIVSLFTVVAVDAQTQEIGGNTSPLLYSTHTYRIQMSDDGYTRTWGLYAAGTTQADIENDVTTNALTAGVDYVVVSLSGSDENDGTYAYFKIQFMPSASGSLPIGNYVIGYVEQTSESESECVGGRILPICLYDPFDIDVTLLDESVTESCPDESGSPKTPDDITSQTTVQFLVAVSYPRTDTTTYVDESDTWEFGFTVSANAANVSNGATVASVLAQGNNGMSNATWIPTTDATNYSGTCTVNPTLVDTIVFSVVFNDLLGVDQEIKFNIEDVVGVYNEQDIDDLNNNTADNTATYTIYGMPDVGEIIAWN